MTNDRDLGRLERVDPRTVWPQERQFSAWLAQDENMALLNRALGLEIELVEQEVPVGDFSVDLFGKEVGSGHEVTIENQLGPTDHGHLGQLLTYAAGLDAKVVVWISPQFRDEHKQTLDWLNRDTTEDLAFFGVQLEIFRIEDSLPAPNFKVLAQPSEWRERVGVSVKKEASQRALAYHQFFAGLLERLKERYPGFTYASRVGHDNWYNFPIGRTGFTLTVEFMTPRRFLVQLVIQSASKDVNKLAFDKLLAQRNEIDEALGLSLQWKRLDDRKMCRIQAEREGSIDSPSELLGALEGWALEQLPRFKDVFGPRVKALRLEGPPEATPS